MRPNGDETWTPQFRLEDPRSCKSSKVVTLSRIAGLGCMRLSTAPDRDEARALHTLSAALDAGVRLFDTADSYAHDDRELHHNERLLAAALDRSEIPRAELTLVTKGGLVRPEGRWVPDGRATHLKRACSESCEILGGPLDLYLLHAPDPKTSLSTSVRALAELQREGAIRQLGLSNINVPQLEEARAIAEISAVELELSLLNPATILGGVVGYCVRHNIRVLAYRPLGGEKGVKKLAKRAVLKDIAATHQATPAEIALAYIYHLHPLITPIPGATRPETAASAARAAQLALTAEELAAITAEFKIPPIERTAVPANSSAREVVILMGIQAAGKSTLVEKFVAEGYARLNRDLEGGTLRGLLPKLGELLAPENARVVLDNTYPTRAARGAVIEHAHRHGAGVRCVHLDTSLEDAQLNAVQRIIEKYGRLLEPAEIALAAKKDPAAFRPDIQFRFRREFEPPALDEGFSAIESVPFYRRPYSGTAPAILFELDGVLRQSASKQRAPISPADVELIQQRRDKVHRAHREGFLLFGISWRPEISAKLIDVETTRAIDRRTAELLEVPITCVYCPHGAGPALCWCRKPLPGLGVALIVDRGLDPTRSIHVGLGPADRLFAQRLGLRYFEAKDYFDQP